MKPITAPTPGDDAVVNERLQPRSNVGRFHGIGDDRAKTRNPQTVIGRIGLGNLGGLFVGVEVDFLFGGHAVLILDLDGGNGFFSLGLFLEILHRRLSIFVFSDSVFVGHHLRARPRQARQALPGFRRSERRGLVHAVDAGDVRLDDSLASSYSPSASS